jgi:superfamily II DNA or RNA helicase
MEITISNKIRIKNCPPVIQEQLIDILRVENPKYTEAVAKGRWTGNLKPFLMNFDILPDDSIRIPRGMRLQLLDMVDECKADKTIIDKRAHHGFSETNSAAIHFRPYQERAMTAMYQAEEGMLVAPAGSGKTVLGLSMIPLYGQPCLWLTHTRALAYQALDRIKQFLPGLEEDDVGILGDGKWKPGKFVSVALIPTLVRRPKEVFAMRDDYGLVILDEAHHCPASTFLQVMSSLNPYYMYGLTATPYRRDKLEKMMFQTIGPEIVRITVAEVEAVGGIIMPKVLYRTVKSRPVYGNNIQAILKDNIVPNAKRNGLIVGDVLREATAGNYCVVMTDRKAHAEILYELISKGWEKTGIATGNYTKKYVTETAQRLNSKEITVLVCTFALLGEGFDVPFLNRAFVTMPFRAEGKVEQLVGRIQRTADGKEDSVVYDYVDVDIGVVQNQFYTKSGNDCRHRAYTRLGLEIEPYGNLEGEI